MDAVVQLCHLLAYHKTIYHIVTAVTGLAIELVNYDCHICTKVTYVEVASPPVKLTIMVTLMQKWLDYAHGNQ